MIEILDPGPLATVQDGGRRGFASLGVARAGAFDRGAHELANRLVGNPADAATIEFTMGGLALRAGRACTVAMTGAPAPGLDWGVPVSLSAGTEIRFGTPARALRSYLAVRGGIAVANVLGSRSTDTLGGIGPAALCAGSRLPVGPPPLAQPSAGAAAPRPARRRVRVVAGPRADWFTATAVRALATAGWVSGTDSDRVGVRLVGPVLTRSRADELPSEATLPGAIQVPSSGQPIVLGPDAPVTGGYPVIAVCIRADLDVVAQLRPGEDIEFELLEQR